MGIRNSQDNSLDRSPNNSKVFSLSNQAALWFSFGVGLLVMQMGSFLAGTIAVKSAILAIVIGSIIGSLILGVTAYLGQKRAQSSAELMANYFGQEFAKLPIITNIIQLLGWTAFEIVIMSEGLMAILKKGNNFTFDETILRIIFSAAICAIIIYLLSKPMTSLVRKLVSKIALPLVILSLFWISFQFFGMYSQNGLLEFWNDAGSKDPSVENMSFFSALDMVIAMPISWLPLVCDYSRFGKSARGSLGGTFIGYAIANIWCYGLGLFIALSPFAQSDFIATILLAQGGLIALGIILFDEMDNAYGDAYSGAISLSKLFENNKEKLFGIAFVIIAGCAAVFLPMHDLEKFLIILGGIFTPLFGTIIGSALSGAESENKNINNVFVWIIGAAFYYQINSVSGLDLGMMHLYDKSILGASLPILLCTFVLSFLGNSQPILARKILFPVLIGLLGLIALIFVLNDVLVGVLI